MISGWKELINNENEYEAKMNDLLFNNESFNQW
jgi:hypothetical protein